jgi:hypothetical protein
MKALLGASALAVVGALSLAPTAQAQQQPGYTTAPPPPGAPGTMAPGGQPGVTAPYGQQGAMAPAPQQGAYPYSTQQTAYPYPQQNAYAPREAPSTGSGASGGIPQSPARYPGPKLN